MGEVLEIHVKSEDETAGDRLGIRVAHCLRIQIIVVIACYHKQIASFQR